MSQILEPLECLLGHREPECGDRDTFDVFCRQIAKYRKPEGWTKNTHLKITVDQITWKPEEEWTTEELAKTRRFHIRAEPKGDQDPPIVIAEYKGEKLVIDGNNRINLWVKSGDVRGHRVYVYLVIGDEEYEELPSVQGGT